MNRALALRSFGRIAFVGGCILSAHCSGAGDESTGMTNDDVTSNFSLLVSASAARSSAVPLNGASLSGNEYIFTSDSTKSANPAGTKSVSYWIDNTAMSGAATHVENFAPYDYVGTADDGSAEAFAASKLSNGTHTITQSVTPTSGAAQVSTATFTVGTTSTGGSDAGSGGGGSNACPSTATLLSSFGSAGTGSDDTATIQKAINSTASAKETLRVASTSKGYILGPISVPSNASVCFDSGVKVTARSGWGQFDRMFTIDRVSNVSITGYGATFTMPPSFYATDSDPEYRHFVSVTGSSNVRVAGMTANTFGGDTLYVGSTGTTVSSNVTFEDVTSNGHTRDGLTVIAVNGGFFRRLHLDSGHVAVDMEPNVATDSMINVHLEDSESRGNKYGGVNVSTSSSHARGEIVSDKIATAEIVRALLIELL